MPGDNKDNFEDLLDLNFSDFDDNDSKIEPEKEERESLLERRVNTDDDEQEKDFSIKDFSFDDEKTDGFETDSDNDDEGLSQRLAEVFKVKREEDEYKKEEEQKREEEQVNEGFQEDFFIDELSKFEPEEEHEKEIEKFVQPILPDESAFEDNFDGYFDNEEYEAEFSEEEVLPEISGDTVIKSDVFSLYDSFDDEDDTEFSEEKEETESDKEELPKQHELEDENDYEDVKRDILSLKNNLLIRIGMLLAMGLFSGLITFANDMSLPILKTFDRSVTPGAYLFTNTILGLASIGVAYNVVTNGIKNLFKRKPDGDTLAALGIFVTVVSGIATLFKPETMRDGFFHVYVSAAIFGLIFNTAGKLTTVNQALHNLEYVHEDYKKYVVCRVDNELAAGKLTQGAMYEEDYPELAVMKRTSFVKDYMKTCYAVNGSDRFVKKISPFVLILGLLSAAATLIIYKHGSGIVPRIYAALGTFSGILTLCGAYGVLAAVNSPITRINKKLMPYSSVIIGANAGDEFNDVNSAIISAEKLFPNGAADFVGIKPLSDVSAEECILMAASVACKSGSVLKTSFMGMVRGDKSLLYPIDKYLVEDKMGVSAWIDNKRVLFGSREFMEKHMISDLPDIKREKAIAKNHIPVYISVSGEAKALFVVKLETLPTISEAMQEIEGEGITLVIKSSDGFINESMISKMFDVMESSVKILPFRYNQDFEEETKARKEVSSPMICSGHFTSFVKLISGAKKLKFGIDMGLMIQLCGVILGGIMGLIMLLSGNFAKVTPTFVLVYNIMFLLANLILGKILVKFK